MRSTSLVVAGIAALVATSAVAADLPGRKSAPAVVPQLTAVGPWTGFYAGVNAGYEFGSKTSSNASGTITNTNNNDGFIGGVQGGYDQQFGNIVAGAALDFNLTNASKTDSNGKQTFNGEATARARLGYLVMPSMLTYGTAGVAAGRFESQVSGVTDTKTHVGYVVGAGAEYRYTKNIASFVEYRYTDFGQSSYNKGTASEKDISTNEVRAGVNYRF
jgi:outer membrane immunogenic protein